MPVYTARAFSDPYTQEDIPPTDATVRSAVVQDAISNLVGPSIFRYAELDRARSLGRLLPREYDATKAEDFMAAQGLAGVFQFDNRAYNQLELSIMARRKQAELKRAAILARADPGVSAQAGRLGLSLVTSLMDPLTVATGFVPVIGPSRYAAMLARSGGAVGRAGVRAGVGAAEGLVGSALVEPVIATAKRQEQADYDIADSLLNIGVGGIFGGGLHVVGGAAADFARGRREAASVTAEREPLITPEAITEPERVRTAEASLPPSPLHGRVAEDVELRAELLAMRDEAGWFEEGGRVLMDDDGRVIGRTQWIPRAEWWPERPKGMNEEAVRAAVDKLVAGEKLSVPEQRMVEFMASVADERKALSGHLPAEDELAAEGLGTVDDSYEAALVARAAEIDEEAVERLAIQYDGDDNGFLREIKRLVDEQDRTAAAGGEGGQGPSVEGRADPAQREAALRVAVAQAATGAPIDVEPIMAGRFDRDTLREAVARQNDPDAQPLADPSAVERADRVLEAGEQADLAAIQEATAALDEQLSAFGDDLPEDVRAELEEVTQAAANARELTKGARLLNACASGHAA
jgi:hypothetical protein